jgi:hypothetical protein
MPLRRVLITILTASLFVAAFALGYPMYVIRPFRAQGLTELQLALAVRSWAPSAATAAAAVALLAAFALWSKTQRLRVRVLGIGCAALTVCFAALTYVNVFEMMFRPVNSPEVIAAAEAKLEPDDMVLAVRINRESRAYPVRMMGYHHISNDWVGGEPLVATY